MSFLKRFAVFVVLLLPTTADACWFDWLFRGPSTSGYAPLPQYYGSSVPMSAPYYLSGPVPAVRVVPVPIQAAPNWAVPTPAPPSTGPIAPRVAPPEPGPAREPMDPRAAPLPSSPGKLTTPSNPEKIEPPPAKVTPQPDPPPVLPPGGSGVQESRSYYDAYPVVARNTRAATGNCTICFWNLSNRDVQVTVEGLTTTILRGKKWTVELPRAFRWQLVGQQVQSAEVGEREGGMEIVIRK